MFGYVLFILGFSKHKVQCNHWNYEGSEFCQLHKIQAERITARFNQTCLANNTDDGFSVVEQQNQWDCSLKSMTRWLYWTPSTFILWWQIHIVKVWVNEEHVSHWKIIIFFYQAYGMKHLGVQGRECCLKIFWLQHLPSSSLAKNRYGFNKDKIHFLLY